MLDEQIERMLGRIPKAGALVENFGGQWLHLRNVADWMPDPERFADFDDSLRYAFERETALFLDHLVREDRSVLELLDADYTFLNERLAGFYGIDGVDGGYFRRVSLAGTARRGVLTHGSVLMVTSYPTRTSPVLRGKWVLENLLGAPPPPPPPDVPPLDRRPRPRPAACARRSSSTRASPACAACHARLDPAGVRTRELRRRRRLPHRGRRGHDRGVGSGWPRRTLVAGPDGLRRVLLDRRRRVRGDAGRQSPDLRHRPGSGVVRSAGGTGNPPPARRRGAPFFSAGRSYRR